MGESMKTEWTEDYKNELRRYITDVLGRSDRDADALIANAVEAEIETEAELGALDVQVDRLFAEIAVDHSDLQ